MPRASCSRTLFPYPRTVWGLSVLVVLVVVVVFAVVF